MGNNITWILIPVLVIVVGVVLVGVALGIMAKVPKERPNKNWVPTAAEVVGETAAQHPVVRFAPPGRDGASELPAALRQRIEQGKNLLVLLDPLNPVLPYQMDKWVRLKRLTQVLRGVGLALVVIGVVALLLMTVA